MFKIKKYRLFIYVAISVLCVMFCFGCGTDIPDKIEGSGSTTDATVTESIDIVEGIVNDSEPLETTSPTETFDYKMVLLNREKSEETQRFTDVYAVEFLNNEHSAATFNIYDSDEKEVVSTYKDVKIETNACRICEYSENDIETHIVDNSLLDSRDMFVIEFSYQNTSAIDDITLTTTVLNRSQGLSNDVSLRVNAKPEDLTTSLPYVHGTSLVKLDGKHYLFLQDGFGNCEQPPAQFSMCHLIPLVTSELTLEEQLNGKFEFVDKNGKTFECPDGYEVYFKTSTDGYDIGIVVKDEGVELTDEIKELSKTICLKYTDKNKTSTVFFSK